MDQKQLSASALIVAKTLVGKGAKLGIEEIAEAIDFQIAPEVDNRRDFAAEIAADAVNGIASAIHNPPLTAAGYVAFLQRVIELLEAGIDGIEGGQDCD
jgi:hypothetical protein